MAKIADSIQSIRTKLGALDPQARMLAAMGTVVLVGVVWLVGVGGLGLAGVCFGWLVGVGCWC